MAALQISLHLRNFDINIFGVLRRKFWANLFFELKKMQIVFIFFLMNQYCSQNFYGFQI